MPMAAAEAADQQSAQRPQAAIHEKQTQHAPEQIPAACRSESRCWSTHARRSGRNRPWRETQTTKRKREKKKTASRDNAKPRTQKQIDTGADAQLIDRSEDQRRHGGADTRRGHQQTETGRADVQHIGRKDRHKAIVRRAEQSHDVGNPDDPQDPAVIAADRKTLP